MRLRLSRYERTRVLSHARNDGATRRAAFRKSEGGVASYEKSRAKRSGFHDLHLDFTTDRLRIGSRTLLFDVRFGASGDFWLVARLVQGGPRSQQAEQRKHQPHRASELRGAVRDGQNNTHNKPDN